MKAVTITLFYLVIFWSKTIGAIQYSHAEFKPKGVHYTSKYNLIYSYYTSLTTDRIIILYFKNDNGVILFKGLQVSENLKATLPDLVIKYIGKHVADAKMKETHSLEKVVVATRIAVERALDQKYKNALLNEGAIMAKDSSYRRGYCNLNWWMPNYYYDFDPAFSKDSINDFLLNKIDDSRFPYLYYIINELDKFNNHHDTRSLAKWPNDVMGGRGFILSGYKFSTTAIKSDNSYHENKDSCRFRLKKTGIDHGKRYPKFASVAYFGWHATYCNFFASDLQKKVFGSSLWQTNGCPKDVLYLKSNPDFVTITKNQAINYAQAGYFTFMISDTHINTIYPTEGKNIKVVQAGDNTGICNITEVWGADYLESSRITAYVYLGYLKSN